VFVMEAYTSELCKDCGTTSSICARNMEHTFEGYLYMFGHLCPTYKNMCLGSLLILVLEHCLELDNRYYKHTSSLAMFIKKFHRHSLYCQR